MIEFLGYTSHKWRWNARNSPSFIKPKGPIPCTQYFLICFAVRISSVWSTRTVIPTTRWFSSDFGTLNRQTEQFSSFRYRQFMTTLHCIRLRACWQSVCLLQTNALLHTQRSQRVGRRSEEVGGRWSKVSPGYFGTSAASITHLTGLLFSLCDTVISVAVLKSITWLLLLSY